MKVRLPVRETILNRRTYEAPAEGRSGKLRLDFNENTVGCSPRVLDRLRTLTGEDIAATPCAIASNHWLLDILVSGPRSCCSPMALMKRYISFAKPISNRETKR